MTNRKGGLLLEDKIVLHLSNYKDFKGQWNAPMAICQDGITDALSVHQPQVAKHVKSLISKGYLKEDTAYIEGTTRKRKIYYLTTKGALKANEIKVGLEGYRPRFKPKELLATLSNAIQDLQQLKSTTDDKKVQLEIISKLQELYYELGHDLNIDESYRVLELSKDIGKNKDVAKAYYYLGRSYSLQNRWNKAIENYQKAVDIAKKTQDLDMLGEAHLTIGGIYNRLGKLDRQNKHLQLALDYSRDAKNDFLIMNATIDMGILCTYRGQYRKAGKMLKLAMEQAEEMEYTGSHYLRLLNSLGRLHIAKEEYDLAAEYFEKTLKMGEERNYQVAKAHALINAAHAYVMSGNLDKSKKYCDRAESIISYLDNKPLAVGVTWVKGISYTVRGSLKRAEKSFEKTITTARQLRIPYLIAEVLMDYSNFCKKANKKAERKKALKEALAIMKGFRNKPKMEKIEKELEEL